MIIPGGGIRSLRSSSSSSSGGIGRRQRSTALAEGGGVAGSSTDWDQNAMMDKNRTLSWSGAVMRISDVITKSKTWGAYSLSLTLRPVYTKALSSLLGFVVGDMLAQLLFVRGPFDLTRLVRMGAFGALVHAPSGHVFYGLLERMFPGVETSAIVTKLAVDQIAWTPVFGSLLFAFAGVTAGLSPSRIFRTIRTSLFKVVVASWALWPVAHAVNNKVITAKHRLLFINCVQVVYNVFLSLFANAV